ncbi:hypothetical protein QBC37DRAFT_453394 [Rhypophila decipiens]|uniref:Uncharacterized protein n=1 Tax=Rhypophila decipiens TaxID=261697 RepID=A0AAN6XWN9_9PEZI|nr:hypothetical protein QBC37DRAFT_453394 [Rhypophila decipiens]
MNNVQSGIGVADDIRKAQEAEVGAGTESRSRDTIDNIADITGGDFPNMQAFESIQQWDYLLTAIEKRMESAGNKPTGERLPPISPEIAGTIKVCQFARDFLTRARRPTWSFVAPGIRTFTDETIREIYSDQSPDSRRLSVIFEGDDYASLLLPGEKVPPDDGAKYDLLPGVGGSGGHGNAKDFDKVWGWSHMAVDRRAGLYITFPDEWDGDWFERNTNLGNMDWKY